MRFSPSNGSERNAQGGSEKYGSSLLYCVQGAVKALSQAAANDADTLVDVRSNSPPITPRHNADVGKEVNSRLTRWSNWCLSTLVKPGGTECDCRGRSHFLAGCLEDSKDSERASSCQMLKNRVHTLVLSVLYQHDVCLR